VTDLVAKRVGSQVIFQFTVPATNVDGRRPADLDRIELYSHTTRLPQPADYVRRGSLVGSVRVRRPPPPEDNATPPPPPEPGVEQGAAATIVDTPDLAAAPPAPVSRPVQIDPETTPLFPGGGGPLLSPRQSTLPTRFYVAVGVNRRGRRGPPSPVVEVPLVTAPSPPGEVRVTYTETTLTVSWTPPSTPLRRPIQETTPQGGALPSRPVVSFASSAGYNVYEVPRPTNTAESATAGLLPAPLNPALLTATSFEDSRLRFGVERCFAVRTQETLGTVVVLSEASEPPTCVTPADTFAPAAPRELTAVASEGAISLLWDPSTDADLSGYLVLRGDAPGEKLQPLTKAPIPDTTFRDTTAQSGIEYVYTVVAVDKANNPSAQSNRVTARGR